MPMTVAMPVMAVMPVVAVMPMPAVMMKIVGLIVERLRVPVMMAAVAMPARRTAVMVAARIDLVGFDCGRSGAGRAGAGGRRGGGERNEAGRGESKQEFLHFSSSKSPGRENGSFILNSG